MAVHGRAHPVPAVISRGSLADAPDLLKRGPFIIPAAAARGWGLPGPAVITAAPLAPIAVLPAPVPVIVSAQAPSVPARLALTSRSSLADAPLLTTPLPAVITQPVRWPPTFPLILSAPLVPPAPPPPAFAVARSSGTTVTALVTSESTVS